MQSAQWANPTVVVNKRRMVGVQGCVCLLIQWRIIHAEDSKRKLNRRKCTLLRKENTEEPPYKEGESVGVVKKKVLIRT